MPQGFMFGPLPNYYRAHSRCVLHKANIFIFVAVPLRNIKMTN